IFLREGVGNSVPAPDNGALQVGIAVGDGEEVIIQSTRPRSHNHIFVKGHISWRCTTVCEVAQEDTPLDRAPIGTGLGRGKTGEEQHAEYCQSRVVPRHTRCLTHLRVARHHKSLLKSVLLYVFLYALAVNVWSG